MNIIQEIESIINNGVAFKYSFQTYTGPMAGGRYARKVALDIYALNRHGYPTDLIGKANFHVLYLAQALNDSVDAYEVFDEDEFTFSYGKKIYDFEEGDWHQTIHDYYNDCMHGLDICFIKNIGILPQYRGYGIGLKAVKDIIFHYGAHCGLFVLEHTPHLDRPHDQDDWARSLQLDQMRLPPDLATFRLRDYFVSMGFDKIEGYENIVFYNPTLINDRYMEVDLED